jgi:hypothetical protein
MQRYTLKQDRPTYRLGDANARQKPTATIFSSSVRN